MPVVSVGQKLPSIYLDRFQPVEGLTYRISVLDTNAIATEFHFIDIPSRGVKGSYQCIQGACCSAFGRRSQTYNLPIYVYRESQPTSTEGELQTWRLTAPQWKKFSDMAMTIDFTVYDIVLVAQKRGYGMDLAYSVVPDVRIRDYWTPEQREQIAQSVASFYQMGEASLVNPMSFNEWNQMLYDCGFDLQAMQWPGGQSPMSQGDARRSVGFGVQVMPPSPGILPPVPGMALKQPGMVPMAPGLPVPSQPLVMPQGVVGPGGVPIMQPTPPPVGAVPSMPSPTGSVPAFSPAGVIPSQTPAPQLVPAGVSISAPVQTPQPAPQFVSATAVPAPVVPENGVVDAGQVPQFVSPTAGVPLGVAPVIPQTASQPVPAAAATFVPPGSNIIPGQQEITMEEMNQLLS